MKVFDRNYIKYSSWEDKLSIAGKLVAIHIRFNPSIILFFQVPYSGNACVVRCIIAKEQQNQAVTPKVSNICKQIG